jgi:hypothetical protein
MVIPYVLPIKKTEAPVTPNFLFLNIQGFWIGVTGYASFTLGCPKKLQELCQQPN